jgi:integrase
MSAKRNIKHITQNVVRGLKPPATGNDITWDDEVRGFGVRITAAGVIAFVLNYPGREGRERRFTIGRFPEWSPGAARQEASRLRSENAQNGFDPIADKEAKREAPTIKTLCDEFARSHLPRLRPATRAGYELAIERVILPEWHDRKVAGITPNDVDALHRKVTESGARKRQGRGAPYRANRIASLLSKMFRLAIRNEWRSDNPVKGLDRNPEDKRKRYLNRDELAALLTALNERDRAAGHVGRSKQERPRRDRAVDIVRLLLLTGARRGEVLSATWGQFNLREGKWTKPAATTKQKQMHEVPLSAPARKLLAEIRDSLDEVPSDDDFVFPGRGTEASQTTLKKAWRTITERATVLLYAADSDSPAGILVAKLRQALVREPTLREVAAASGAVKLPIALTDLRVHDLRHSYASFLVSAGLSLPTIGALLGHTQPATTARYAHLFDDPLRTATDQVGSIIAAADSEADPAKVVKFPGAGRV